MPKITIQEKDLTRAFVDELNNNIAYIPGYAIKGPINEPTICSSLSDFYEIFGAKPYQFKHQQTYKGIVTAETGSYEQSYLYAAELLANGLTIMYERVFTEDVEEWTSQTSINYINTGSDSEFDGSFEIKSRNVGAASNKYAYAIENLVDEESGDITRQTLIIAEKVGDAYTNLWEHTISFDPDASDYYALLNCPYVLFEVKGTIPPATARLVSTDPTNSKKYFDLELRGSDVDNTDEFTYEGIYDKMSPVKDETTGESGATTASETPSESETTHETLFKKLADKGEYNIKFITSGAYPAIRGIETDTPDASIALEMLTIAAERGDAIAIYDYEEVPGLAITGKVSLQAGINNIFKATTLTTVQQDARKYGALFAPHAYYSSLTMPKATFIFPGSFAYLASLANSIKTNENWYAVAGVARGLVPNLQEVRTKITGAQAEALQDNPQDIYINPITYIRPYGYCIWGNRTMHYDQDGLVASSFLNIRALTNDIKKVVYTAAKELTFELNTDVLWLNFKAKIEPTLDRMTTGNGLDGYKIIRKATNKRATLAAVIRLYPIEAVEDFDITIELADGYTSVEQEA